jgi:hypothetical protein
MALIQNTNGQLIISLDSSIWDEFCWSSDEASPFMLSWYSDLVSHKYIKYFYVNDSKALAAILIYLDEKGIPKKPAGFPTIYHSICYSKDLSLKNGLKMQTIRLKIMNDVINNLLKIYKDKIFFSFNTKINDLRSLLWLNYSYPKKMCNISLRYTAIKYLEEFNNLDSLLSNIRLLRRREYKKSLNAKFTITDYVSLNEFLDLHRKTLVRKNIIISVEAENNLKNFYKSLTKNNSFFTVVRDKNNTAVSLVTCLIDNLTAHSLFIFNDGHSFAGTRCMIEAIMNAKKIGKKFFDFIGANSPNRGDFKISFRAKLVPYYEAEIFNVN